MIEVAEGAYGSLKNKVKEISPFENILLNTSKE